MKARIKIALIGALMICAVCSAAFSTVRYVQEENSNKTAECMTETDSVSYVLKEYEGHVAVFMANDLNNPVTVTDIQVSTLRELDKKLMETGMTIDSRERLMMTLEDLGS
jgi:hypothetical protein